MSNDKTSIYKVALMEHYRKPRNKHQGPFPETMNTGRGSNPSCGDDIEVGVDIDGHNHCAHAAFRGRGCSVCMASASMMTEAVSKMAVPDIIALAQTMQAWIDNKLEDLSLIPEILQPLDAVKSHPARKKCVMLGWNAISSAVSEKSEAKA